ASPASSDSQGRVDVSLKSSMKTRKSMKSKQHRRVYWNMRHQPSAGAKRSADAEKAMAAMQQTHEFGIDSMASIHISGNKSLFTRGLRPCKPFTVTMADNGEARISQVGSIELHIDVAPGQTASFVIDNVHYHPHFGANLLS